MAQSVTKTVIARYKAILESENRWIQPEFKKPCLDLVWNRDYSLNGNMFSVNTLAGRVKLLYRADTMERYFDKDIYKFGTAKLVFKHNKWFLHIPVTFDVEAADLSQTGCVVGIDRGINFVITTYDTYGCTGFVNGRTIKQKRAKYQALRKDLQKRGTPSSRRRLKCIGNRENRWMQDVNHCISKALVTKYPKHTLFVLEDLEGIHKDIGVKVNKCDRWVHVSWSFYDLACKLKYKALANCQEVIEVNPAYTSQQCPKCGHTEFGNRNKKKHMFECKCCGYKSNDDRIGAMNLYRKGIDYVFANTVPDTVTSV